MKKLLLSIAHLVTAAGGLAAGVAWDRAQPHPPKAGDVGFSLISTDCQPNDRTLRMRCTATAIPLVWGTDGQLHTGG